MATEVPARQQGTVPSSRVGCPTVVPAVCVPDAAVPDIELSVNAPGLPGFTVVANGGAINVGNIAQTGAAGPFTEHDNQLELRIANDAGAGADLNFLAPVLTPVAGYGSGGATLSAAFSSPLVPGASQDRFIQNITDQPLPVAFQLDVSVSSDDPDEDPYTISILGTFTV